MKPAATLSSIYRTALLTLVAVFTVVFLTQGAAVPDPCRLHTPLLSAKHATRDTQNAFLKNAGKGVQVKAAKTSAAPALAPTAPAIRLLASLPAHLTPVRNFFSPADTSAVSARAPPA